MNSKLLLSLFTLLVVRCEARGRSPGSAASTSAFTEATSAATTDTNTSEDDSYVTLVKGYIDAGTCDSASTNSICGDDATSYYKEFEYNGQRVVISNGIPDHTAESDAVRPNENTRCEVWQFMSVPLNPTKADEVEETDMGVTSLAVTGGTFFNYLSSDDGSVALYNEGDSLDSCMVVVLFKGVTMAHARVQRVTFIVESHRSIIAREVIEKSTAGHCQRGDTHICFFNLICLCWI